MNKVKLGILAVCIGFASCGEEKTNEETHSSEEVKYQIDAETISLNWTAFKTTEKIGVKGEFGKVNVTASELADEQAKAINNVSFSVPVSSLFTNNEIRDNKLMDLFFGVMDDTEFLKGTFHSHEANMEDGKGVMDLTMNGKTCDLPYTYTLKEDTMFIATTLNVMDWNGQKAMDSLNAACFDLHKGSDGVSKTWNEVDINASVVIKSK